jgi:hypothetical protein
MSGEKFRIFVPGKIWTVNAERSGSLWVHRKNTADMVASALLVGTAARVARWGVVKADIYVKPVQARQGGTLADTGNHLPAAKAAIDGLVQAGLMLDDDPTHMIFLGFYPPVRAKKGNPTGVDLIVHSR